MPVGVTGLALPALAQGTAAPPPATTAAQAPATVPTVNAEELGVSVDRIRLQFRRDQPLGDVFDPARFKLSTYVDVVATAPPLQLFGPDPKTALTTGAVPFGGPTHRDMLNIMTPQEFRTPPADLTALIEWLSERLRKQSDRDRE
jgi:hypothetical protein